MNHKEHEEHNEEKLEETWKEKHELPRSSISSTPPISIPVFRDSSLISTASFDMIRPMAIA
jgi:hypothetical protein